MPVALLGVSFLTPLDGLFVLAAALPLGALLLTERRAARILRLLSVVGHRRRAVVPVVAALMALSALVAVAAAQPVVVRQQLVSERADAQAFVLFDTSLSMRASAGPGQPSRLQRAKRMAIRLQRSLSDVPFGIASMTDRSLPNLMPTTDQVLFARTARQSVAIDQPPPSQQYKDRDGESSPLSPLFKLTLQRRVTTVFVHVWEPGERIYNHGKPDPRYVSDPTSMAALSEVAQLTGAPRAFSEGETSAIVSAARSAVGRAGTRTHIDAYARIALAPWFVLGCIVPLAFLLWRRNF